MRVELRHISDEPRHFDFTFQPGWWECMEGDDQVVMGLESPIIVWMSIRKEGTYFALDASLKVHIKVRCDRCLEPYTLSVDPHFRLILSLTPPQEGPYELALGQEDLSMRFIEEPALNVDEMVREQIYLSLPMKCLCRKDCAGLCPVCGENLNLSGCTCRREIGHPAFSKLKDLKLK